MKKGVLCAVGAYGLWGVLPIYWKLLHAVPAQEVIAHRIAWSFVFLGSVLTAGGRIRVLSATGFKGKTIAIYGGAGLVLSVNWFIYIWGVNADLILETSLGYFINPLLNVLLGAVFLRERLRPAQWVATAIAAAGVIYLGFTYGRVPWIALGLASTFSIYGLAKKLAPLASLPGLALETAIMLPVAIIYLCFAHVRGVGAFMHRGAGGDLLLVSTGIATTIPLLLFAAAAREIPLTMLGMLQYIAPTLQFLVGVFIYREPFESSHLAGFGLVWSGLALFLIDNFAARRPPPAPIAELGEG